jgi:hypothetical protein
MRLASVWSRRDDLWRRYREALEPLRQMNELGPVLLQSPTRPTSAPEGVLPNLQARVIPVRELARV